MKSEALLQKQVVAFFTDLEADVGGFAFFSCPNEGRRSAWTGHKMKSMGLRSGVHDLIFLLAGGRAVLIELKSMIGKLSPAQVEWDRIVTSLGFTSLCIKGDNPSVVIELILEALCQNGFKYEAKKPLTMKQLAEKWVDGWPV